MQTVRCWHGHDRRRWCQQRRRLLHACRPRQRRRRQDWRPNWVRLPQKHVRPSEQHVWTGRGGLRKGGRFAGAWSRRLCRLQADVSSGQLTVRSASVLHRRGRLIAQNITHVPVSPPSPDRNHSARKTATPTRTARGLRPSASQTLARAGTTARSRSAITVRAHWAPALSGLGCIVRVPFVCCTYTSPAILVLDACTSGTPASIKPPQFAHAPTSPRILESRVRAEQEPLV
jgi:hypothetical protein